MYKTFAVLLVLCLSTASSAQTQVEEAKSAERQACRTKAGWQDMAKQMTERIKTKPDDAEAYCKRANARKGLGRLDEALSDFGRAISLKPDYVEAYFLRGNTYVFLGQKALAIQDYSKVIELDPNNADAFQNRALAYQSLGKDELSAKDKARATELIDSARKKVSQ